MSASCTFEITSRTAPAVPREAPRVPAYPMALLVSLLLWAALAEVARLAIGG
jgi:hypothetical protein